MDFNSIKQDFYWSFSILSLVLMGAACGPNLPRVGEDQQKEEHSRDKNGRKTSITRSFGNFQLSCGINQTNLDYQIKTPEGWNGKLFAMVLNGSPGTLYFGDNLAFPALLQKIPSPSQLGITDPYAGLINGLLQQGYRVLEAKYARDPKVCGTHGTMEGFYSVCCGQGLDAVEKHNAALYDAAVAALDYHSDKSNQKLSGFGFSLGGTQVESMAFLSGKKFEKVGITGVLIGKGSVGCGNVASNPGNSVFDGESWTSFVSFADAVTRSTQGCSSKNHMEYDTFNSDFENFQYKYSSKLAIFEGARQQPESPKTLYGRDFGDLGNQILTIPGLDLQAKHIQTIRNQSQAPVETVLELYQTCGHEVLFCPGAQGKPLKDILSFFDPQR
jgi:hypothetical protein